jgi:hypothetical protein
MSRGVNTIRATGRKKVKAEGGRWSKHPELSFPPRSGRGKLQRESSPCVDPRLREDDRSRAACGLPVSRKEPGGGLLRRNNRRAAKPQPNTSCRDWACPALAAQQPAEQGAASRPPTEHLPVAGGRGALAGPIFRPRAAHREGIQREGGIHPSEPGAPRLGERSRGLDMTEW